METMREKYGHRGDGASSGGCVCGLLPVSRQIGDGSKRSGWTLNGAAD